MFRLDFFFHRDWCRDGYSLWVGSRGPDGLLSVCRTLESVTMGEGDQLGEPTLLLRQDEAQKLFQSLYDAGLRPSNGDGSVGQLGATERHLEDMRRLVFGPKKEGQDAG